MAKIVPDITFKQHDTWPPLTAVLSDVDGALDLTTAASVKLIMKGATVTVTGTCTIGSPTAGEVSYLWATGDLAIAGDYSLEFEITFADGKVETVPNDGYKIVRVKEDLG